MSPSNEQWKQTLDINIEASSSRGSPNVNDVRNRRPHDGVRRGKLGGVDDHDRKNKKTKARDTHFLCFPLVSESSVRQLDRSLRHFRGVAVPMDRVVETDVDAAVMSARPNITATAGDGKKESSELNRDDHELHEKLRVVAESAHRPPGTFHLTIGVMDLSQQVDMERARALLGSLDLAGMLKEAALPREQRAISFRREGIPTSSASKSAAVSVSIQDDTGLSSNTETTSSTSSSPQLSSPSTSQPIGLRTLSRPVSPPPTNKKSIEPLSDPLVINLTGLSTFPSAKESRVFYAPPIDPTGRLLSFAQLIRRRFREEGFITETRELTLHATVANLRYAVQSQGSGKQGGSGKSKWQRMKKDGQVDGRSLIDVFNRFGGDVESWVAHQKRYSKEGDEQLSVAENEHRSDVEPNIKSSQTSSSDSYIWARDIEIDAVAICKMGAERSSDPVLGMVYPPIMTKSISDGEITGHHTQGTHE